MVQRLLPVASKALPSAELIMVKCRQAKSYLRTYYRIPEADAYDESDIVARLKYIHDISQQRKTNRLSSGSQMGTNMGDHTGNSFLNIYLNTLTQGEASLYCHRWRK